MVKREVRSERSTVAGDAVASASRLLSARLSRMLNLMNGLTLTSLLEERVLEEETQHFPRCVRSSRISVGADRAASRPCVSSSVDIPVLQDAASARVAMDSAGIGMP